MLFERPRSSLACQTPAEFATTWQLMSGAVEQSPQQNEMIYRFEGAICVTRSS
jgi:hypothetical protein